MFRLPIAAASISMRRSSCSLIFSSARRSCDRSARSSCLVSGAATALPPPLTLRAAIADEDDKDDTDEDDDDTGAIVKGCARPAVAAAFDSADLRTWVVLCCLDWRC